MVAINKGDNTGAFGHDFLRIYLNNPNNLYIQKAVFQVNENLEKVFYNPVFPLRVNFSGEETELLSQVNKCKLALWDENGRRRTAEGKLTFFVKENHIKEPDDPLYTDSDIVCDEDNSIYFNLEDAEFAALFTIDATPTKMSELQQDINVITAENIIGGRNIHTFLDPSGNVVIEADLDTTVSWRDVTDKPTINGMPLIGNVEIHLETEIPNADWDATEGSALILNKPTFATVAYTGLWSDIVEKPAIPTTVSELENDVGYITKDTTELVNYSTTEEIISQIESSSIVEPIINQITELETKHNEDVTSLQEQISTVRTNLETEIDTKASIEYVEDLTNGKLDASLLGKGKLNIYQNDTLLNTFSANATSNMDIEIDVPTKVSELENDLEFVTAEEVDTSNFVSITQYEEDMAKVATIDSIGTGILTIKQNGDTLGTFNANSSNNKSVNITIPLNLSDLDDDIGVLTANDLTEIQSQITTLQTDLDTTEENITNIQDELNTKVTAEAGKTLISKSEIERLSNLTDYDDTEVRTLIESNTESISAITETLANKVDVEDGKGLSTNDYTDEEMEKLDVASELVTTLSINMEKLEASVSTNTTNISTNATDIANLTEALTTESTTRETNDNYLQEQIDGLTTKSTVADLVATEADLETYDTTSLLTGDVICVLCDETKNNVTSYYRWNGSLFTYVGCEGEYYTKSTANSLFALQTTTINGYDLSSNITLTYTDVGALPKDTIISNASIFFQKNGTAFSTITLNQEDNQTVNIIVPEALSELENDCEFITLATLLEYIGDVSLDNSLQDQINVLSTQVTTNTSSIESLTSLLTGTVDGLPAVAVSGSYNDLTDLPDIPDSTSDLENDSGFITMDDVAALYTATADLPTKLSEFENDRGYVTNSAIGRGVLTLQINSIEVGTWMANEKDDYTWNIPVDSELSLESILPVQNNTVTTELQRIDATTVHLTGDETITGVKSFENVVITTGTSTTVDTDDNSTNIATTAYVQNQDYCTNTDAVHKEGTETITGNKTFTGTIVLNTATGITMVNDDSSTNLATTEFVKNQDYAVNSETVHIYYNETIQGDKTFNDTTTFVGIVYLGDYAHVSTPDETNESNFSTDLVVNVEYVQNQVNIINNTIINEVATLNQTITDEVSTLNTTITNNVTTLNNTISSLESTLTAADTTLQSNINTVQSNLDTLESTINTKFESYYTQTQVDSLLADKEAEISTLQGNINTLESTISSLQDTIASLQEQINALDTRVTALEPITEDSGTEEDETE